MIMGVAEPTAAVPASTDTDRAETIIVLAKEPLPGRAKTRLQTRFTPDEAAELAAAALNDTLQAVRASGVRRRILAWAGNPGGWQDGFDVIDQGGGGLDDRLALALDTAMVADPGRPVLLIAMDTPQLTPELLNVSWDGADAVLGLTDDGGYWGIGLRHGPSRPVFAQIPMSTERTGAAQLSRLLDLGYRVKLLPPLRDVDTPTDAAEVAEQFPWLRFSAAHRRLTSLRPEMQSLAETRMIFDHAYTGRSLTAVSATGTDPLRIDDQLWQHPADDADRLVVARSQPPVIDLGCGPGRMVTALVQHGRAALGVDLSGAAVASSQRNGGPALRRDLSGPLPGEGRWETVLLMDSNIGIGGDVDALLRRCARLAVSGGLIICETDPDPDADELHEVLLRSGPVAGTVRWARIGATALIRRGQALGLIVTERWTADGRVFVAFRTL
ncbi:DUF2064 domain-containing protein [Microlunatus soli]|uniref:Uncharacterized conserved protein, glycosyltransferase A (GT-A) superfamily, DUF2064 family n=1 Tax=Microlunatus soli TaxID=630515 RepID=A0A1H1YQS2_9ACTN|nr:DUF2064 domain-containing protein [Microlunatus soli]SDT23835.1 Uncharacterized conserved protein, glycosyltransferase A (GT-A) superfamily, DUF2064 family [Microlunatus soli]